MSNVESGEVQVTRGLKGIKIEVPRDDGSSRILEYKGSGSECEIQFHSGWTAVYSLNGELRRCTLCLKQYFAGEKQPVGAKLGKEFARLVKILSRTNAEAMLVVNVAARKGAFYALDNDNPGDRHEMWTISFAEWLKGEMESTLRTGLFHFDDFKFRLANDGDYLTLIIESKGGQFNIGLPLYQNLSFLEGSLDPDKIREKLLEII